MKLLLSVTFLFCTQISFVSGQISLEANFLAIKPLGEFGVNTNRDVFFGRGMEVLYRFPGLNNLQIGLGYSYSKYDEGNHSNSTIFTPGLIGMIEELKTNVSMQSLSFFGRYDVLQSEGNFQLFGELSFGLNCFVARKKSTNLYFRHDSNGDGFINTLDEKIPENETNLPETVNTSPSEPIIQHQDNSPYIGIGIGSKYILYKNLYILITARYTYGFNASYFDHGSSHTIPSPVTDYWNIVDSETSTIQFSVGFGWEF